MIAVKVGYATPTRIGRDCSPSGQKRISDMSFIHQPQPKQRPLEICPACGGSWFCAPEYYRFRREETLGGMWLTRQGLIGQDSPGSMIVTVCLCGMPQTPHISGELNREPRALFQSLKRTQQYLDDAELIQDLEAEYVRPKTLQALADRLDELEKRTGRWLAKTDPHRHSPRGRYWAPPTRKPASGQHGTLTRDGLVVELQRRGFLFRDARKIVNLILNFMIEHLQDGETVETPLVTLRIARRPKPKNVRRFGRRVTLNTTCKRVGFRTAPELKTALQSVPQEKPPMPELSFPNQLRCDKCGSLEFFEAEFHQYVKEAGYSHMPDPHIRRVSPNPIRIQVCLCGKPIWPGRLRAHASADRESFRQSFESANRQRDLMARVSSTFASKLEYHSLEERIAKLEQMLQGTKKKK